MDAVLACLEEIALEGLDGCPIKHLWNLLEQRKPQFPLKLDDAAKEFLWQGIVEVLDVRFYLLKQPLPHIFSEMPEDNMPVSIDNAKDEKPDFRFNTFCMVNDTSSGTKGSCPEFHTRKDVTTHIRGKNGKCIFMLKDSYQRWGDSLVMVASQAERSKALSDNEMDPNAIISDNAYCLLEHVGMSRYRGRLQSSISKYLCLDFKTAFYYVKRLMNVRLVAKQNVIVETAEGNSVLSNIVRLNKFDNKLFHKYESMGEKISRMLEAKPEGKMFFVEYKEVFGGTEASWKTFKRARRLLQNSGHLKLAYQGNDVIKEKQFAKVEEKDGQSKTPTKKHKPLKKKDGHEGDTKSSGFNMKSHTYIQLVKPYRTSVEDEDDVDTSENTVCPKFVHEHSLLQQIYDCIEQHGPGGASLRDAQVVLGATSLDMRLATPKLEKKGHIKSILVYAGRANVKRFVADCHVENSALTSRIVEEERKLKSYKETAASKLVGSSSVSPNSPCPSPSTHSVDATSPEDMQEKGAAKTYRALKRKNIMLDFIRKYKVSEGTAQLFKAVDDSEAAEGMKLKVDRKSIKRLLNELLKENVIKVFKTLVHFNNREKMVEFYLDSSIDHTHELVRKAIKECEIRHSIPTSGHNKAQPGRDERGKFLPRKEAKSNKKLQRVIPPQPPKPIEYDLSLRTKYGYVPKLPRVRLLHEFLWYIIYAAKKKGSGKGEASTSTTTQTNEPRSGPFPPGSPPVSTSCSVNIRRFRNVETSIFDYSWTDYVEALPVGDHGLGWFNLGEAMQLMPFSVYCKVVGITAQTDGMEELYNDPKRHHTMIKDLPTEIQSLLRRNSREKSSTFHVVENLLWLGLITPKHPMPSERFATVFHMSAGGILVDTTTSLQSKSEVIAPPNQSFPQTKYVFHSFTDVRTYWDDMKSIALNTMLGFRSSGKPEPEKPRDNRWTRFRDFKTPHMHEESIVPPPGNRKGAAGFDSFMYTHLMRNWSFIAYNVTYTETMKRKAQDVIVVGEQPPAKKPLRTPGPKGAGPTQPTSPKKKTNGPSKSSKSAKKRKAEKPKGKASPSKKKKKSSSQGFEPEEGAPKSFETRRKRADFTPEQDKMLIVCKIVMGIMNFTREPYPWNEIKKIIEENCEVQVDKSPTQYNKRVLNLMKNCKVVNNVKIYVAEYLSEKEFQGLDDRSLPFPETFRDTVKKVYDSISIRGSYLKDTSKLVSSLDELYNTYKVHKLDVLKNEVPLDGPTSLGPPVLSVKDVRTAVARDIIQVACNSKKQLSAQGTKALQPFTAVVLKDAISSLMECGMTSSKKNNLSRTSIGVLRCHMSNSYYRLFDNYKTRVTTFKECTQFEGKLNSLTSGGHVSNKLTIDPKSLVGGDVACILTMLITGKLNTQLIIPDDVVGMSKSEEDLVFPSGSSHDDTPVFVTPKARISGGTHKWFRTTLEQDDKTSTDTSTLALNDDDNPSISSPGQASRPSNLNEVDNLSISSPGQASRPSNLNEDDNLSISSPGQASRPLNLNEDDNLSTSSPGQAARPSNLNEDQSMEDESHAMVSPVSRSVKLSTQDVSVTAESCLVDDGKIVEDNASSDATEKEGVHSTGTMSSGIAFLAGVACSSGSGKADKAKKQKRKKKNKDVGDKKKQKGIEGGKPDAQCISKEAMCQESEGASSSDADSSVPAPKDGAGEVLKVFEVKHGFLHSLFSTPYKLPESPMVKEVVRMKQVATQGNVSRGSTSKDPAEPTTLPAPRPSRIGLMISRNALTAKQQEEGVSTSKCYSQVDVTKLNHCKITISPTWTSEELSDKVQSPCSAVPFSLTSAIRVTDSVPTLNQFLETCIESRGYERDDVELSKVIHNAAERGQELGISLSRLKEEVQLKSAENRNGAKSFQELLNNFYQDHLLWRVGTFEELVVCNAHIKAWCFDIVKGVGTEETPAPAEQDEQLPSEEAKTPRPMTVLGCPWLNLVGGVNKAFMRSITKSIVATIMENPGLPLVHLQQRFMAAIAPVTLMNLLEFLEHRKCISIRTLSTPGPFTLFSKPQGPVTVRYLMPQVDGFVNLNSILKEIDKGS